MIFAGRTTTVSAEDERDRGLWMFVDSQDNQGIAPYRLLAKHAQSCNARPQKLHRQLLRPKPSRNRRICREIPADADSIRRHLDKDGYGMMNKYK